jgi:hypothetical protein
MNYLMVLTLFYNLLNNKTEKTCIYFFFNNRTRKFQNSIRDYCGLWQSLNKHVFSVLFMNKHVINHGTEKHIYFN